jgi:hypothetical protein
LLSILAPLLSGCGAEGMGQLSGTVNLDGKPLETGTITLIPVDGATATAGGEIKDGRYQVEAPLGTMKVSLSAPKVTGSKKLYDTPDSPTMPITVEALPARYNQRTELKVEIKSGANQKDFDLQSTP